MTTRHTTATNAGDRTTPACHHDRQLDTRITTGHHTDDCPIHHNHPEDCPGAGHRGCLPCDHDHCVLCRETHTDRAHPITCPECIGKVRTTLHDILWHCRHLRWQAARGGHNGRLTAAAPIPGGDALVLYARAGAFLENMRTSHGYTPEQMDEDHHPRDVVPVLLPLASWAIAWRTYLGHDLAAAATVSGIVHYLADGPRLQQMAQTKDGPDWTAFVDDMRALLRQLEGVLHDEAAPERGVSCFQCGKQLVRRFGKPAPCEHSTPARRRLAEIRRQARRAADRVAVIRTYPELGAPTYADLRAARRVPTTAEEAAARVPCEACVAAGQGGIEDPTVGQSWECTGCRKQYTPGEYANAVRADLQKAGPDGDGWTYVTMAAEAASTQTGAVIAPGTVRRWMEDSKIRSCCRWSYTVDGKPEGQVPAYDEPAGADHAAVVGAYRGRVRSVRGLILVYWPDVADRAADLVVRQAEQARARAERVEQARRFYAALRNRGISTDTAAGTRAALRLGKGMGIHPNRVRAFIDELDATRKETASAH